MSPREIFRLAVRIIGLVICLAALLYLLTALLLWIDPEYFKYRQGTPIAPFQHYLLDGLIGLAAGIYLMRGGSLVVRLAFGKELAQSEST